MKSIGHQHDAGLSRLELVVAVVLISVFAGVLLQRLAFYQEVVEKVTMEQTVQSMRSGLQMQIAALLLKGKAREIGHLSGRNPVSFLANPPAGYVGEIEDPEAVKAMAKGSWYFDKARRELVYLVDRDTRFTPGPDGISWARFRTVVQFSAPSGAPGSVGELGAATIIATNGFVWRLR
jgi:type II secretory pathway pseudopilin PulG